MDDNKKDGQKVDTEKQGCEQMEEHKRQGKHFIVVYIIGLFSVALVLILLSYLTQVRADEQLASKDSELSAQISATQGAVQRMETLQALNEEQKKQLDQQKKVLNEITKTVAAGEQEDVSAAVSLLKERYIALDALQQARRLEDSDEETEAKEILQKMIKRYGVSRLVTETGDVLLGENALEFEELCEDMDVALSAHETNQR